MLVLYGQRINVEIHNAERLSCHPGDMVTYDSKDLPEGVKQRHLQHFLADKVFIFAFATLLLESFLTMTHTGHLRS